MSSTRDGSAVKPRADAKPELESEPGPMPRPRRGSEVEPEPALSAESPPSGDKYITGVELLIVVAAVTFATFFMLLDTMIAIPKITDTFHSLGDVGWYGSAYQFGSAAPQLLTGRIYKYFNTKWTFLTFFGIFELGSALCGAAVSSDMFIVGRCVAGLGAAGVRTGAITIISSSSPLEKRPTLIGLSMAFGLLGVVLGPLVGGLFTSYATWRWCFYVNLPAGALAALPIIPLHIPQNGERPNAWSLLPRLHHHLDLVGFLLFAPAVLQLLLALQFGGQAYSWNSSQVIGLFCGAAASSVAWFFWNRHRAENAMIPHPMLTKRDVAFAGIYEAFLMASLFGGVYFLPIYFQAVHGASAIMSGVYLLPIIIAQLIAAGAVGGVVSKIGYVIPVAFFSTVFLSLGSGLYSLLGTTSSVGEWVGFQIITGIGSGAGLQLAIIAVQVIMDGEELSTGIAFVMFSQALGPAIGLALCNIVFAESLRKQIAQHAPGASVAAIVHAGATDFRSVVAASDLPGVLVAYAISLRRVFYLVAALGAACALFFWGMGWHDVRGNKTRDAEPGTGERVVGGQSADLDEEKVSNDGAKKFIEG